MRLSGHSFNNETFQSLKKVLEDAEMQKEAQVAPKEAVQAMEFTETTQNTYDAVVSDEVKFMQQELVFAADRARVKLTNADVISFIKDAHQQNLRGKNLERFARKFVSRINHRDAAPVGHTSMQVASVDGRTADKQVRSASYSPNANGSINDSKTGGYMGMSKNPNTIWDTDAMARFAQVKHGDEKIKESKVQREEFKKAQKQEYWDQIKQALEGTHMSKIAAAGKEAEINTAHDPKLPANVMSAFSDDRDFANIPEQTQGETLAESAKERSNKNAQAKDEWNQVKSAQKADNSLSFLFNNNNQEQPKEAPTTRSSMDIFFEGLMNRLS